MFLKIFRYKLLFAFLLLVSVSCSSQIDEKYFIHLTTRDGFTNNEVSAITQDRFGYLWVGTEQGLNRFDGLNVQQFFTDRNAESLTDDRILSLKWIDSNLLAVTTRVGINLLDIRTMKFAPLLIPAKSLKYEYKVNRTRGLLNDANGNFYIITRTGFYHLNSRHELIYRYDDYTLSEMESGGGGFGVFFGWLDENNIIVTGQKGNYCYNIKNKTFVQVKQNHPAFNIFSVLNKLPDRRHILLQAWPGRFIIIKYESDSAIYIDESKKMISYSKIPFLNPGNEIGWRSNLFVLNDSCLLLSGKNSGFLNLKFNKNTGSVFVDTSKLLNHYQCNDFFTDRQNRRWIAANNGLLMENKHSSRIQSFVLPDSAIQANPRISLNQLTTDSGFVYAGGVVTGGVYIFNKKNLLFVTKVNLKYQTYLDKNVYAVKHIDPDTILCGTNTGLFYYYPKINKSRLIDLPGWDFRKNWISGFYSDSKQNIWITSNRPNGCYFYKKKENIFEWVSFWQKMIKEIGMINCMEEDRDGNIWIGGNALTRYNTTSKKFDLYFDSLPSFRFQSGGVGVMAIDKDNNIWMGSATNGLILYEPSIKRFSSFTRTEGLPDNYVKALKIINGSLWIACKSGITRLDLKSREIVNIINSKDLDYESITCNKIHYDSISGMIYIGKGSSIIRFEAARHFQKITEPHLLIESIIMNEDSIVWNPESTIRLNWNLKNITLTFNSINFNDAQDQRYAYRIINGNDSGWIMINKQRRIIFGNLSLGKNEIEIKVWSLNRRWTPQFKKITIFIAPPFWRTGLFFLLCSLVITATVFILFRYRINQLKKIIYVRSKISQDLHDEVGSTLSGIAMYSHLTREQIKNNQTEEINNSLGIIQNSASEMVNRLSDIVWIVNPRHDSLQKLVQRLEEFATEMAAAKNMKVNFNIQAGMADLKLPMESRRNIYLICKEAINNTVKYSHAEQVDLSVKEFDHSIEILIKDNGIGFHTGSVKKGDGLHNMQKRADDIRAKLEIISKQNEGTSILLQCKIT